VAPAPQETDAKVAYRWIATLGFCYLISELSCAIFWIDLWHFLPSASGSSGPKNVR
jgi:hypothetical protein